jgi:predicted amidohydrolase
MRAAAIQLTSTTDVARNVAAAEQHVRAAAADGAALIVLPEKWTACGRGRDVAERAQPLDGDAITWARALAAELNVDLVAGSLSELREDGSRSNTSVHIGPDGEIRAVYRKIHMFDVTVEGTVYRESEHEQRGEEIVTTTTGDGTSVGMSICYDLRFPELYRVLAVRGARVLVVPSAFTLATTREHWEILVRARAIENQCFVIAANQVGEHAEGIRSGGRSMIVDPWGVILAQAPDRETHVTADLDFTAQDRVRADLPALANRRPQAYAFPTGAC